MASIKHEDDDDEELKAAIALSLAGNGGTSDGSAPPNAMTASTSTSTTRHSPSIGTATFSGIAGLNRAAMERERLARQAARKRERSISPPAVSRKAPKLETTTFEMPSGARLNMFSTLVDQDQSGQKPATAQAANVALKADPKVKIEVSGVCGSTSAAAQGDIIFPNGVVKKTWAFGHERAGDEIKLEEVLEPRSLKTGLLSAFQWDTEWVLSKLNTPLKGGTTKCIFVMQAKDETLKKEMLEQTKDMRSFLRLCFPPMDGQIHCMHSKLMLLFHPHKLRVAIPTANLLNFDWGESGMMENSVFLIDLPRLDDKIKASVESLTGFGRELLHFLKKQGIDEDIRDGIINFDYSATRNMAFIHTAGGASYGDDASRTGLPGLSRAIRSLGLQADNLEIDFAASSIGSLNDDYLRTTHAAAKGEDLIARADAAASKAKTEFFNKGVQKNATEQIRDKIRIYFPTHETVTSSTATSAGTICLSRKWWENMPFPRSVFRDYISTRSGLLSHNKLLYARGNRKLQGSAQSDDVAWVYVGSANMSESAWGRLVYDRKAKAWKINCRNWECGVLYPVPKEQLLRPARKQEVVVKKEDRGDSETESEDAGSETESEVEDRELDADGGVRARKLVGMDVFDDLVIPPFEVPGKPYGGRDPWYFMERRDC
ncbi:hypothetical protein LTR62_007150 [Meristemomyces frigidus]|uniref:Phospholipase D/nuclease n=1 Tax=Meristemomyces frigidus TaxID=1508187 RepID=A0AAN7YP50_9PEZI|nr:hypothetical protein LTR62_007150 [Meristemomyces frigidus]